MAIVVSAGVASFFVDSRTHGRREVLISPSDADRVQQYKWRLRVRKHTTYISSRVGDCEVYLHRMLTDAPDGMQVDHINGNGLDNRQENLRLVTRSENEHNQRRAAGYSWFPQTGRWRARIKLLDKEIHLGYFRTQEEARAAYLAAKARVHKGNPITAEMGIF